MEGGGEKIDHAAGYLDGLAFENVS